MVQAKVVELAEDSELARIVDEVGASREPVIVRTPNGQSARINPWQQDAKRARGGMTQEAWDDFFTAAGSWADVDIEALKAQWRAARGQSRHSENS